MSINVFQPLTIFAKCSILDVRLGSECASETFRKTMSCRIMSKITVSGKDKAFARTELHHRYLH